MDKQQLKEIDSYAGNRMRDARKESKLSLQALSKQCGVTWQQLQKYESGANRMSVSRLCQISAILDKPVFWFFPIKYGGDMSMLAVKMERIIKHYRDKEDRILEILTEK